MTTEELLKDALNKLDLINRPNIIFVNPKDKDFLFTAIPNISEMAVVEEYEGVEKGKLVVVDRKEFEKWVKPRVD